jgi:cbb3-type cytochrome oxidase cytochrome c subunit
MSPGPAKFWTVDMLWLSLHLVFGRELRASKVANRSNTYAQALLMSSLIYVQKECVSCHSPQNFIDILAKIKNM